MKLSFCIAVAITLLATKSFAQTTVAQPTAPTVTTPTAPYVAPVAATSTTPTASAENDMMQQLQKLLGKKNSQKNMGQALVIGTLLGCTQKTAGADATNAFYSEMKAVGKTVEEYCKQGQAKEAREVLITTFHTQKDNAVVKSALGCYDQQANTIAAMGGERLAKDSANYARYLRDPKLAEAELKENDICRNKKG